ncbi:MAG: hypothetical protein WAU59_02050 [Rhodoplanes sp.]
MRQVNTACLSKDTVREGTERITMLDLVMLAIAAAFFVGSVAYAYACDRL